MESAEHWDTWPRSPLDMKAIWTVVKRHLCGQQTPVALAIGALQGPIVRGIMNRKGRHRILGLVAALSLFTMSAFALPVPATAFGIGSPSEPILTCGTVSFDNIPTGWVVMLGPDTATYGAADMPINLPQGGYFYTWLNEVSAKAGNEGWFGITGCTPPAGPTLTPAPTPVPTPTPVHTPVPTRTPVHTPVPTPTPVHTPTPVSTPSTSPTPSASPSPTPLTASTPTPSEPPASVLSETASPCLSACGSGAGTGVLLGSGSNGGDGFPWPLLLLGGLALGALALGGGILVAKRRSGEGDAGSGSANRSLPSGAAAADPGPPAPDGEGVIPPSVPAASVPAGQAAGGVKPRRRPAQPRQRPKRLVE